MRRYSFRRSREYTAHEIEEKLQQALLITGTTTVVHGAAELLGYVTGQLAAIEAVVAFAGQPDDSDIWRTTAVHGFMTGSADLLLLLRESIGFRLPARVRLTRGLSHKFSEKDKTPDQEFYSALNSYEAAGVSRLVLIDEVVGGGSALAQLKRFRKWRGQNPKRQWPVLYIGLTERDPANHNLASTIATKFPWVDLRLIRVPDLPAMDENGQPISSIVSIGFRYYPYRFWGGGYEVRCANLLTTCTPRSVAAGPARDAYRSAIYAIVRAGSRRGNVWPEGACAACSSAINDIRARFSRLPRPDQGVVVATVGDRKPRKKVVLAP